MAEPIAPSPVKLICGMLTSRPELFREAREAMARTHGPTDLSGEVLDFDFTDYYFEEMGRPLYRRFFAFERLVGPEELVEAKVMSNSLESDFASRPGAHVRRPINLDPGYVDTSKLVLASMKNFSHRLYLGRRVYGEVTLTYAKGAWRPMPWTFPDYASGRYSAFLDAARDRLKEQRKIGETQR